MASLADGESNVRNPLISRDTTATIEACRSMGATIEETQSGLRIEGTDPVSTPDDVVNVENSGSTLRFMTSALATAPGGYAVLTGDASIRKRPMQPLLDTLSELGVEAWSTRADGRAPIVVKGGGIRGGEATMKGDVSSQFVSSVLISAPKAAKRTLIEVADAVSRPYIDATLAVSRLFGIAIAREGYARFIIEPSQKYRPADFAVPADFSSAAFIIAAVSMCGGRVELQGLDLGLPQGDSEIVDIVRRMGGAEVRQGSGSILVESEGGRLSGGVFDLGDTPDLLPVVAALALRSDSPVEVVGTAHARFKETDRIAILAAELSKLGVRIEERQDGLKIYPLGRGEKLVRALLDAHDDHRMFMAFALASMQVQGGTPVRGVESLDVSYPTFLEDIKGAGATVKSEIGSI
jgi:3-phosphoshikimate 1-carboxyvinyltransferase